MSDEKLENIKLKLAAEKIVDLVSAKVGNWIKVPRIILFGQASQTNRKTVYSTLETYGFHWDESQQLWASDSPMPDWVEELVGD
jgi:hypothetical protein